MASLMTVPHDHLLMHEASLPLGGSFAQLCLKRVGWQLRPWNPPHFSSRDKLIRWVQQNIPCWGTKEVNAPSIHGTVTQHNPKHILVLVRDARHCGMSYLERQRNISHQREKKLLSNLKAYTVRTRECADLLVKLARCANATVAHYDQLVSSEDVRRQLSEKLNWPMTGDLEDAFWADAQLAQAKSRRYEVERHGATVSDASVALRESETDETMLRVANAYGQACADFQEYFGYA